MDDRQKLTTEKLQDRNSPTISVIICTRNEGANIQSVLAGIPSFVYEVIMVDGKSKDDTISIAKSFRPDIRILSQPGIGKPDALLYGFKHAKGDIIVTLDADGTTDPRVMSQFIEPLLNGYSFVKGSRFANSLPQGMPRHRQFGNRALAIIANILYGTKYTDLCSGYNAFWKDVFEQLRLRPDMDCDVAIHMRVARLKIKYLEVPHYDRGRLYGKSKMPSIREGYRILKTILVERFRVIN